MTSIGDIVKPESLNIEFFKRVLNNDRKNSEIKITKCVITNATSTGDNYCSDIYRVNLVYDDITTGEPNQNLALIVKSMPELVQRGTVVEDLQFYEKEIDIYFNILPRLTSLLGGAFLVAKCYYATKIPYKIVVFQDLQPLGYQMCDRSEQLDFNHCEWVLRQMGKLHAASYVYNRDNDHQLEKKFDYGMYNIHSKNPQVIIHMFTQSLASYIGMVKKWDGFGHIIPKLEKIQTNLEETYVERIIKNNKENSFRVLNHGDMWVNNFLFKYDSENPKIPQDAVLLDYQIVFFSSPAIDLHYFFNTSVKLELLRENGFREKLIGIYYDSLSNTMKNLKVPMNEIPKPQNINDEMSNFEFYGFFTSVTVLPILLMEKPSDLDSILNNEEQDNIHGIMFSGKRYQECIKYTLKRFDEMGVLD